MTASAVLAAPGIRTVVAPRLTTRTTTGRLQRTIATMPGTSTSMLAVCTTTVRITPFLCVASGSKIEFWNLEFGI